MKQQLSVKIEDGQLKISIGIALLAFAVQGSDQWPPLACPVTMAPEYLG